MDRDQFEELACNCGTAGSGEHHKDWCLWLAINSYINSYVEELRDALEWALDILEINDNFIREQLGAECDQRIDQAAKVKARRLLIYASATPDTPPEGE